MADLVRVQRPVVFVMPFEGSGEALAFPWRWTWQFTNRLIVETHDHVPGNLGTASFRLLRQTRREVGDDVYATYTDGFRRGQYVAIAPFSAFNGQLDPDQVLWFGTLAAVEADTVAGTGETMGSATAREVGYLLDQQQVDGFRDQFGRVLLDPPTANLSAADGELIGNARNASLQNGTSGHRFAADPKDCAPVLDATGQPIESSKDKLWSRWRLLRALLGDCQPTGLPKLALDVGGSDPGAVPSDGIGAALDRRDEPEVLDVRGATWKGALDLLVSDGRGLAWEILPRQTQWTIRVYVTTDSALGGLPVPSATTVDTGDLRLAEAPHLVADSADQPDAVVVEDAPILMAVGLDDRTFEKGWSDDQEEAYEDADPEERTQPQHADVFVAFRAKTTNGEVFRGAEPGNQASTNQPLCPLVEFDATTGAPTLTRGTSRTPYVPAARLSRVVPWRCGQPASGQDQRDAVGKALPSYLGPRLFHVDRDDDDRAIDLTAQGDRDLPHLSLDIEERGLGFRVRYSPQHLLAKGHLADAADRDGDDERFDYEQLVLTCGVQSDQRLRHEELRPGVSASQVRHRLVVRTDRFQCWIAVKGTPVGVKDAKLERIEDDTAIRNDFLALRRFCRELAAWAFRTRQRLTLVVADPNTAPAIARLGTRIGNLVEGEASHAINTVVSSLSYDWVSGRLTITTDLPAQPGLAGASFAGGGTAASPSGGGRVALSSGGTPAQVAARADGRATQLAREAQHVPAVVPMPAQFLRLRRLRITGGKDLGGDYPAGMKGVLTTTADVGAVPVKLDPNNVANNAQDGFGWATDVHTDEKVLVVTARIVVAGKYRGGGVLLFDLPEDTEVLSFRTVAVPAGGGDVMLCEDVWLLA